MCSIDLEPCAIWRETPRMARKPHRCDCCGAPIAPKEAYLDHFSVYEGDATHESMCFACWLAREEFVREHGEMIPGPSAFAEILEECVHDPADAAAPNWRPMFEEISARRSAAQEKPQP